MPGSRRTATKTLVSFVFFAEPSPPAHEREPAGDGGREDCQFGPVPRARLPLGSATSPEQGKYPEPYAYPDQGAYLKV
jgi:hypothetical protein